MAELMKAARSQIPSSPPFPLPKEELHILRAVHEPNLRPTLPRTGLRNSWLFTATKGEPSLYSELRTELETAESLDLIISFIKWSGYRKLEDVFQQATAQSATGATRLKIRILTTTYLGATDRRAVDALAKLPGVQVRVSLDGRRERLHAKAWIFGRKNGFGTAFVGSANLSKSALIDGIEWTLKIPQAREPILFEMAHASFETHWNDQEFQPYDPYNNDHVTALDQALSEQRDGGWQKPTGIRTWFDIQPKPFQQQMLEQLDHERSAGRTRNLLVAATGTGKTVISAFDYKRLCERAGGSRPRVLFVAHQAQILLQALATFRQVLRDSNFGELLDGNHQPDGYAHLFATIQTIAARHLVSQLGADHWQMVVVDEAHHIPAPTFDAFVGEIRPRFLLGLTATPERADGRPLSGYFDSRPDGSPACSLRIWDALDQQLLCPFEYYATSDSLDLQNIDWGKAREIEQLGNVISSSTIRAQSVINSVERFVDDVSAMRAVAFCVSVDHANFMARQFEKHGIPAIALTGADAQEARSSAIGRLEAGQIKVICTINLFNEGVDIPTLNTLFLLRPTQSPVVFQQQIGRGLRLHDKKTSCLVLDYIGQHGQQYRFDVLYRSLTGLGRKQLSDSVERGFGSLPAGCHIQLDKVSRERVLQSLRQSIDITRRLLERELAAWAAVQAGKVSLASFLQSQMISVGELYENRRSWTELKRAIGLHQKQLSPNEFNLLARLGLLVHVNDVALIEGWILSLNGREIPVAAELMLAHQLIHETRPISIPEFRKIIQANESLRDELLELLPCLIDASDAPPVQSAGAPNAWPLKLHCRYSRRQIQAAIGHATEHRRPTNREGILVLQDQKIEILFVTLDKSSGFAESVQYPDYAVSASRFHWKTQNRARPTNSAGRRYLESATNGWKFFLFVRESRDFEFVFAGQVTLDSHEYDGRGPIGVNWNLVQPLSAGLFRKFSVLRDT